MQSNHLYAGRTRVRSEMASFSLNTGTTRAMLSSSSVVSRRFALNDGSLKSRGVTSSCACPVMGYQSRCLAAPHAGATRTFNTTASNVIWNSSWPKAQNVMPIHVHDPTRMVTC